MTSRYNETQIAQCSIDAEGNILDPVTLEVIAPDRLVSVQEGSPEKRVYYCFDIDTLYKWVKQGNATNPFTRVPLPKDILDRIQEYGKTLEIEVIPLYASLPPFPRFDTGLSMGNFLLLILQIYVPPSLRSQNVDLLVDGINALTLDLDYPLSHYYTSRPLDRALVVTVRTYPASEQHQQLWAKLHAQIFSDSDEHRISVFTSGSTTPSIFSVQFLTECFDLNTGQTQPRCAGLNNISPMELARIRHFIESVTFPVQIMADDYQKHISLSKERSVASLILDLASILPDRYDDVGRYEFIYDTPKGKPSSLYDIVNPKEVPVASLLSSPEQKQLIIDVIEEQNNPIEIVNHRAQTVYDIAMDNNRTGIADRISTLYPGVRPRVTEELTGAALEQQRRVQERNLDVQLTAAIHQDDVNRAKDVIQLAQERNQPLDFDNAFMDAIAEGHIDMVRLLGPYTNIVTVGGPYDDIDIHIATDAALFRATYLPDLEDRTQIVEYLLYQGDDQRVDTSPVSISHQEAITNGYVDVANIISNYLDERSIRQQMQIAVQADNLRQLHQLLDLYPDIGMGGSFDWIVRFNPTYLTVKMFFDRGYTVKEPLSYYLYALLGIGTVPLATLNLFLQNGMVVNNAETQRLLGEYSNGEELRAYIRQHPDGEYIASEDIYHVQPPKCCTTIYEFAYYGRNDDVRRMVNATRGKAKINSAIYDAVRGAIANGNLSLVQEYIPSRLNVNARGGDILSRAAGSTATNGAPAILQYLISQGADLERYGSRALEEAARTGNIADIEILLNAGVDPNNYDAMKNAVTLDYVGTLTLLLNRARYSMNTIDRLLVDASRSGSQNCGRILILYGASAGGSAGRTAREQVEQEVTQ